MEESTPAAIPFACIISLLPPACTTTAVPAFSVNAPGGMTPTVDSLSPLQREELVWSQYPNLMNDDYSPGTVLDEVTLVKDVDLAGNSSVGLGSGIVYHPDGFLIVVHHSSGSLFKIKVKIDTGSKRDEEIKLIKVVGGPLTFGERLGILSPRKLVVAGIPTARLLKSSDGWETASVIGKLSAPAHRLPTAVAVKDERVYIN
ncbi:hypothetical protein WN943_017268 [Citrus x changshan-huyou]